MSDLDFSNREQLDNPKRAVGMYSKEREYVSFTAHCRCEGPVSKCCKTKATKFYFFFCFFLFFFTGITDCKMTLRQVEVWLTHLEETMKECVRGHLSDAVRAHEDRPREQWILDFPAQVALTGSQIWWNNDMELVFRRLEEGFESALKDYNKKQVGFPRLSPYPGITCGLFDRTKINTRKSLKPSHLGYSTKWHIFYFKEARI